MPIENCGGDITECDADMHSAGLDIQSGSTNASGEQLVSLFQPCPNAPSLTVGLTATRVRQKYLTRMSKREAVSYLKKATFRCGLSESSSCPVNK